MRADRSEHDAIQIMYRVDVREVTERLRNPILLSTGSEIFQI